MAESALSSSFPNGLHQLRRPYIAPMPGIAYYEVETRQKKTIEPHPQLSGESLQRLPRPELGKSAVQGQVVLNRISELKRLITDAKVELDRTVVTARIDYGHTWQAIADAAGVRQPTAVKNWSRLVKNQQGSLPPPSTSG